MNSTRRSAAASLDRVDTMLDRIIDVMRVMLPEGLEPDDLDGFVSRYRPQMYSVLERELGNASQGGSAGGAAGTNVPAGDVLPEDVRAARARAEANLAAMKVIAAHPDGGPLTAAERTALESYSGWGGVGLDRYRARFPAGASVDPNALIHEYYSPTSVADAVGEAIARLAPSLPTAEGAVQALEPSAGIGRYIRSAPDGIAWTAVEFSAVSARILALLRPEVDLTVGTFESWVAAHRRRRFGLVVSNPPYGKRGASITEDPDRGYRERDAYIYFLLRTADLLAPNGVGIYLIPRGFMDGATPYLAGIRERVLKRHHLMGAFRLPSNDPARGSDGNLFPGANVVVDLVFLRARGGELGEVDEADRFIVEGRYYREHPAHILGREIIEMDPRTGRKARFGGYEVHGEFTGLPEWTERPMCGSCVLVELGERRTAQPTKPAPEPVVEESEALGAARTLGQRVEEYLLAIDKPDTATLLHDELVSGLEGWVALYGSPAQHPEVRAALARRTDVAIRRFSEAFQASRVAPALATPPKPPAPPYSRAPDEIADWLYRQHGAVTVDRVAAEHRRLKGHMTEANVRTALVGKGWCLDGDGWDSLVPERVYVTGYLWPKHDRAVARAEAGDEDAKRQLDLLRTAIKPAVLADIENMEPRQSWLPLDVITAWANDVLTGRYGTPVELERDRGLLQIVGEAYDDMENTKASRKNRGYGEAAYSSAVLSFIGWANHDKTMFRPEVKDIPGGDKESLDEARLRVADDYRKSFAKWLERQPEHAATVVHAYNRLFRGYVKPERVVRPLRAARWRKIKLHDYQAEGAQRVIAARRGLLAFDVGLGKTYTALAIIAEARQEGWAKRPVLLVPNSLVWKWKRDIAKALPSYQSVVIGSELYQGRGGKTKSRTDTAAQRGQKWTAFRAGAYDVAIVAYSVFHRTKMRPDAIERYVDGLEAIQRTVALRQRNIKRAQDGKNPKPLSERDEAILREGARAWVAEKLELPSGQSYDEGVVWDDIGVDLIVVDESQNFKNLYLPEEREGGVPDYMGNPGEGSDRAWNLDFRAASVRDRTGGAGVVLLSATPAKNSPLELYNAMHLIDPMILQRAGITDPEHFIDRFCSFEKRTNEDVTGKVKTRLACTRFVNLHELRDLLYSVADYKTAAEVGLKLPDPETRFVTVQLDDRAAVAVSRAIAEIEELEDDRADAARRGEAGMGAVQAITMKIMGLKMRISMLGIHGELPGANAGGGNPEKSATVQAINPHSSKIDACVKNVMATRGCGHIVFCDFLAAHVWLKKALIAAGMPEDRIAVLNAPMVPSTEDRQRIAMQFNGVGEPDDPEYEPARYDVVIANAVAYEGVDLQRRTCAIHHLDLPWEPATLHQRNGRAVRQGNTLGSITLYYYLAAGTGDKERLDKIRGKAGWMNALNDKNARETANPAASLSDDGFAEVMIAGSRDPEAARARFEAARAAAREEARQKRETNVRRTLRAANEAFRTAERKEDPADHASWLAEAERRLELVLAAEVETFPWVSLAPMVRAMPIMVSDTGPLVYEGLVLGEHRYGRIGRDESGQPVIGRCHVRQAVWTAYPAELVAALTHTPADVVTIEPPVPEERDAMIRSLLSGYDGLRRLRLDLADEQWVAWFWPSVRAHLARVQDWSTPIPVSDHQGVRIQLGAIRVPENAYVYPPTAEGLQRWAAEAPTNPDLKFADVEQATRSWWGRRFPLGAWGRVRGGEDA